MNPNPGLTYRRSGRNFTAILLLCVLLTAGCGNGTIRYEAMEPYARAEVRVDTLYAAAEGGDLYCNGAVPVVWKGRTFCMWQASERDEDSEDTHVVWASSDGRTGTLPRVDGVACSSGGWIAREDSLIALVNIWTDPPEVAWSASGDGVSWTRLRPVLSESGEPLRAIFEQDPHVLPSGRIVGAAHFPPGLHLCPVFTDDPSGVRGWRRARFDCEDIGEQSRALEPSMFLRPDGDLVMLMRDQQSSFRKLAAVSRDEGETWSGVIQTEIPDSRSKQCAGNLPDGQAFTVGNIIAAKDRTALHVSLSRDGLSFDRTFELLSPEDLPPRRFEGRAKTLGYSYPKAWVDGDTLIVACSVNKEAILLVHIPVAGL